MAKEECEDCKAFPCGSTRCYVALHGKGEVCQLDLAQKKEMQKTFAPTIEKKPRPVVLTGELFLKKYLMGFGGPVNPPIREVAVALDRLAKRR